MASCKALHKQARASAWTLLQLEAAPGIEARNDGFAIGVGPCVESIEFRARSANLAKNSLRCAPPG